GRREQPPGPASAPPGTAPPISVGRRAARLPARASIAQPGQRAPRSVQKTGSYSPPKPLKPDRVAKAAVSTGAGAPYRTGPRTRELGRTCACRRGPGRKGRYSVGGARDGPVGRRGG